MQALKGVVILMTLAIAVLMTLIVYGMYQKSQDPDFKFFDLSEKNSSAPVLDIMSEQTAAPTAGTQPQAFGDIALDLPAGGTIQSAAVSANRLTVVVRTPAGDEVWVVNLADGAVLGRVRVHRAAP